MPSVQRAATSPGGCGILTRLDHWMAAHPWHPRVTPFVVYLVFFSVIRLLTGIQPMLYPVLYVCQCGVVLWLLWRYRALLPELTVSFHWLAVPVGGAVFAAWVLLGWWTTGEFAARWEAMTSGQMIGRLAHEADYTPHTLEQLIAQSPAIGWSSMILRLLGMSIVVPLCEELFIRSLLLRSFHRLRRTGIGALQLLQDMPVIGEWLMDTSLGRRSGKHPPVFGQEFLATPLGRLSVFGVVASTFVFMLSHAMRDWPAIWVCGIAYCLLLALTARKGLGPVIWAHGVTNAMLWAYTVQSGDWQFL